MATLIVTFWMNGNYEFLDSWKILKKKTGETITVWKNILQFNLRVK